MPGLRAARWRHLLTLHTSNSVTDEVGELFLAEGLIEGEAEPEETELLKVWRLPLQEAITMALDECTPFPATEKVAEQSMEMSMRWARRTGTATGSPS